jgi:very-short-patch-repair endonuclease
MRSMSRAGDPAVAAIADEHHGVFSHTHARGARLTEEEIRLRRGTGEWILLYEGVYPMAGAPPTWRGNLLAACWAGGFRAAASHRSAAALWNLAGARRTTAEITCPRWKRARHDGLVVHESTVLERIDMTLVDGIPVTTPERTLLDLGATCHHTVVEIAMDAAERRGLVTNASVREVLRRLSRRGRRGVRTLRAVLDARAGRNAVPESEMETRLVQLLRRQGLPEPVLQHEIRVGSHVVGRVDAAYPDVKLALEYDSFTHHSGRQALVLNSERRNRLLALGWTTITVTAADVRNGGAVVAAAVRNSFLRRNPG